ncbi:L,D-transpeptidase [Polaromonas sp.]|uniref:L,D-transpeptidase n=1 Tax=Polaromonas sp. TaxID=1869339 RepID=UPI00286C2999|nr:L,D-transpeptidase [Polaromonas sp.]
MQDFTPSNPELPPAPAPGAGRQEWLDGLKQGVMLGAAILALTLPPFRGGVAPTGAAPAGANAVQPRAEPRFADFAGEEASPESRHVADWVVDSGDNRQLSFVIIDKKNTRVYVFDAAGKLRGATPVLIGSAKGDDAVTGIGGRPIAEVQPHERTTAAGRFLGEPGRNASGEDVVWVDYDAAVSMHRVRTHEPKERRLERLASASTDDNRISYGCINMPVAFFDNVLKPAFNASYGVVYVLPEVKSVAEVFGSAYDVAARHGATPAS